MTQKKTGIIKKQKVTFFTKGKTWLKFSEKFETKWHLENKNKILEKGQMRDTESTIEIKIQFRSPLCPIQTKKIKEDNVGPTSKERIGYFYHWKGEGRISST